MNLIKIVYGMQNRKATTCSGKDTEEKNLHYNMRVVKCDIMTDFEKRGNIMNNRIIYEDSDILVCYKASGMPVQSGRIGTQDMVSMLKNHLAEQSGKKGEPYLGLVHRLDQPVEGLLVFAKTKQAAASLSAQVQNGIMKKYYRAVVCANVEAKAVTGAQTEVGENMAEKVRLTDWLVKDNRTNSSCVVKEGTKDAKKAVLEYKILKSVGDRSLVEIELFTGRHHQIRVQMAATGMPLVGDRKYNTTESAAKGSVALCACRLEFVHPKTKKKMTFSCEPENPVFAI